MRWEALNEDKLTQRTCCLKDEFDQRHFATSLELVLKSAAATWSPYISFFGFDNAPFTFPSNTFDPQMHKNLKEKLWKHLDSNLAWLGEKQESLCAMPPPPLHSLNDGYWFKSSFGRTIGLHFGFSANDLSNHSLYQLFSHLLPKPRTYFHVCLIDGTGWIFPTS